MPSSLKNHPASPFYSEPAAPSQINFPSSHGSRSIFWKLLLTAFFLSAIPIVFYMLFSVTIYFGSIRPFLPIEKIAEIEDVFFTQVLLVLILFVIAVVFSASLVSHSITRPLKRILDLTSMVGDGKLHYRLKIFSHNEIGELTEAFNVMIAKLREQQEREQLITRLKSEFISIAAHQMRTPLSTIKWTFQEMLDEDIGKLSEEQKTFLRRGYETNENMIRLVTDLLNVARIEEGRFGYTFLPIETIAYIKRVVGLYEHHAQARGVSIHFDPPPKPFSAIFIDSKKMDIVFQNLFDNAAKYSKKDSIITVFVEQKNNFIEISIKDQGVGIPKHQMKRLFSKFFRGDNVIRIQTEGSGLGLFIVNNIIQNHGGAIAVESEEGAGTTVHFTIPISATLLPKKEIALEEFMSNL